MIRHVCGAFLSSLLFDQIYRKFKIIPHPYTNKLLREKWLIDLSHVEDHLA